MPSVDFNQKIRDSQRNAEHPSTNSFKQYSDSVLVKRMDRSSFVHHGTHIPIDVLKYWLTASLQIGESKPIMLIHNVKQYNAKITREKMGRHRLFWHSDFDAEIRTRFKQIYDQLANNQIPDDYPYLRFQKLKESEYIVDFIDETIINEGIDSDDENDNKGYQGMDGKAIPYFGTRYERDPKNRRLAVEFHGLKCYGCGFNFGTFYGRHGEGFIEIHHLNPLSELTAAAQIDPTVDLVPLCANCHRMIHRNSKRCLTLDELKEMIQGGNFTE